MDAPEAPEFRADPKVLHKLVTKPERIRVLAPGEPFTLKRVNKDR